LLYRITKIKSSKFKVNLGLTIKRIDIEEQFFNYSSQNMNLKQIF